MQFCDGVRETDSKMELRPALKSRLESDPNFIHIDTADLLDLARKRNWTLDKLTQNFKTVDRALLIALLRKKERVNEKVFTNRNQPTPAFL